MLNKLKDFWSTNRQEVLSIIGVISILGILAYLTWQILRLISGFPGFQFDPFVLIAVIYLGTTFTRTLNQQTKILEKQEKILEILSKSEVKSSKLPKNSLVKRS
jgi:hypothetical protein